MNVVILEDEELTAERLTGLLHRYDPTIRVVARLASVADAVAWFGSAPGQPDHSAVDLVFMDIHLEDDLAFRLFEHIHLATPVIFTTAYDEYMIRAFKVNSIDYLLKPINYDELVAAITKFKTLKAQFTPQWETLLGLIGPGRTPYKNRFMITVGTRIRSVEVADIAYFYLDERMVFLVSKDGHALPLDYSLDKLTQLLDPRQFFRISRQFLVSLPAIHAIHAYSAGKLKLELVPKARAEVFVSGDRITDFKEWLGK